jgi:hypothetical protein
MNQDINEILLFEKAFKGAMSEREKQQFDESLLNDEELQKRYRDYTRLMHGILEQQRYTDLMALCNEEFKARDWSDPAAIENSRKVNYRLIFGIIGVTIILGIVGAMILFVDWNSSIQQAGTAEVRNEPAQPATTNMPANEAAGLNEETLSDTTVALVTDDLSGQSEENEQLYRNSAFLISPEGYFLTTYDAVSETRSVRLRRGDTLDFKTELIIVNESLNLAVLKVISPPWDKTTRLPYRLAGMQASQQTAINFCFPGQSEPEADGEITGLADGNNPDYYAFSLPQLPEFSGLPVISRNGNVVGIFINPDDKQPRLLKSTVIARWLTENAGHEGLKQYRPVSENRLAGLERENQILKLEPFVLAVVPFY